MDSLVSGVESLSVEAKFESNEHPCCPLSPSCGPSPTSPSYVPAVGYEPPVMALAPAAPDSARDSAPLVKKRRDNRKARRLVDPRVQKQREVYGGLKGTAPGVPGVSVASCPTTMDVAAATALEKKCPTPTASSSPSCVCLPPKTTQRLGLKPVLFATAAACRAFYAPPAPAPVQPQPPVTTTISASAAPVTVESGMVVTDAISSVTEPVSSAESPTMWRLPQKCTATVSFDFDGSSVATQSPFTWWNPSTWYRLGTRRLDLMPEQVIPVSQLNRGANEEEMPCVRINGDLRNVMVVETEAHWAFWLSPRKRTYVRTISGTVAQMLLSQFQARVPSVERLLDVAARTRTIDVPRVPTVCHVGRKLRTLNLSCVVDNTCHWVRDVKIAACEGAGMNFLPGSGVWNLSNSDTASPMYLYLRSLPLSILRSLCSMAVWRLVAQSILASVVMWLAHVFLPVTLITQLAQSLGANIASSLHHQN